MCYASINQRKTYLIILLRILKQRVLPKTEETLICQVDITIVNVYIKQEDVTYLKEDLKAEKGLIDKSTVIVETSVSPYNN